MFILTEKPSVAKDFATALNCKYSHGIYTDGNITIANCIGHLFELYEPVQYDSKYKNWNTIPIIPEQFLYKINDSVKEQAELVIKQIKLHSNDEIIIATDADREGEIIARECFLFAGIKDFSKIKRFWVSQALTPEVINEGIKNAKPLTDYNLLSSQGFARQHSDWLIGINFTRYITSAAYKKLPVGRVQTAILKAIQIRCNEVENFIPEKYYEYKGYFQGTDTKIFSGLYFDNNKSKFSDENKLALLKQNIGYKTKLIDTEKQKITTPPPQLYNLVNLQKDAFKHYSLSAAQTLKIVQKLYEEYKCVSYPRTPSRVMGEKNIQLCIDIFENFVKEEPELKDVYYDSYINYQNKRCFNDKKLEAHHALIPLKNIPADADMQEKNIYNLIKNRFLIAFLEENICNKYTYKINIKNDEYRISAKENIQLGWKKYSQFYIEKNNDNEEQELINIDWDNINLIDVKSEEKYTQPKKYFNEASILAFMENPKNEDIDKKLVGLGTAATRHTYIPKLEKIGYIKFDKKNILITKLGNTLLDSLEKTPLKRITDISETTEWEEKLNDMPEEFYKNIKEYVFQAVQNKIEISVKENNLNVNCPLCNNPVKKGKNNWYCSSYKNGCKFTIWFNVSGTKITEKDLLNLCSGKLSGIKKCKTKNDKEFSCRFKYNTAENKLDFIFENKTKK